MIALVHEIIGHHRLESPTHTFVTDCPAACLQLSVDRNMMHRVFDNLLSNAVKYSPAGGTIYLSGAMRDDNLVITVKDEGIGMTPDQIDQAFNKFYRVDPSDTAVRGLGLGLTICKAIIEAHGGSIWIDSHPGQGTEVHFSLPLQLSSLNQRTKSS
jgi:signal transduction histidine kinase